MAYDFPSSPSTGTQYMSPNRLYVYEGTAWSARGSDINPNPFNNSFKYRTVYTRGYVSAGYRNSTPWRNVNKTVHATDVSTNLGDLLDYASSYINGSWSDYYHYVYGNGSQAVGGSSTYTSSINMATEANRSHSTNWDTKYSRGDCGVVINPGLTIAYITGGGDSNTDKHNLVTDIMYNAGSCPANPVASGATTSFFGEKYGWVSNGGNAALNWSNETWTSGLMSLGGDGHGKSLSSKHGWAYSKPGSYASSNVLQKINDLTGATLSTTVYSPDTSGEENFEVGQNHGYCLGNYNGAQNNNSYKVNYLTDAVTAGGADMQPKGHDGMSSGCCGSASAQIVGGA